MAKLNLKLYNFEKEGRGVEPDEQEKPPLIRFFTLYFRNFGKMLLSNLVVFADILIIASVLASFIIIMSGDSGVDAWINSESFQSFNQDYPWVMILVNIYAFFTGSVPGQLLLLVLFLAAVIAFGPLSAGLFYQMRNYAREEHVFFTDIFSVAKENLRRAIPLGLIDIAALYGIGIYFFSDYASSLNVGYGKVMNFLKFFAAIIFIFYLVIRIYLYMIIVTFEVELKEALSYAVVLTYSHFFRSLLFWGGSGAVIFGNVILPLPSLLLVPLFDISFMAFLGVFICYKPFKKYLIDPVLEHQDSSASK